ncbi:MAG: hypothetical protein EBX41_03915 [Chitinophagia bacterium]|nr:hypothetical protein [Chitinophagia bacterium]
MQRLVIQKTNTYNTFGLLPGKLWFYNLRYGKRHLLPDSALSKNEERPVLIDTSTITKSVTSMARYLFNQGYFYAQITDSVYYRGKKAKVVYNINAGNNYLIKGVEYRIKDPGVAGIANRGAEECLLKPDRAFTFSTLDEEQLRLVALIRNQGYYRFTQDNIRFELDTLNATYATDNANLIENALTRITTNKSAEKPTLTVALIIDAVDTLSQHPYTIGSVAVYPNSQSEQDDDTLSMPSDVIREINFYYKHKDVSNKVIAHYAYHRLRCLPVPQQKNGF